MPDTISATTALFAVLWLIFAAFALVAVVQRWRGNIVLGLDVRRSAVRQAAVGFGIGALAMTGTFLLEWALGAIRVEAVRPDVAGLVGSLGILTAYAAFEEVLFRVLMLNGMLVVFRRAWPAIALTAVLFGLAHVGNEGATALSVTSNAIGGVMYGLAFVRTRRVWMPLGLHLAWNWVQGPVLGFPISGVTDWSNELVHQVATGSELITGGSYGPEGGVVAIACRFVVVALVLLATRPVRRRSSGVHAVLVVGAT